jgi:hypothetical protein
MKEYEKEILAMGRPKVTQMVIDEFTKVLDAQNKKGMAKYKVSIDDVEVDENGEPYNWPLMAMEELADFSQYQVKEILRLRKGLDAWAKIAREWEERAITAEISANEMAEESAVVIEQLQKEVEELKRENNILKWQPPKHNCRQHAMVVWGPGVNNVRRVFCKECSKTLYEAAE